MSKIFSPKKAPAPAPLPAPEPLPPPPSRSDAENTALADEQRRRVVSPKGGGRAGTFFTGSGVTEGSSAVRFLGASRKT